jgi:iron complex transport system ATP-binding protein
MLLDEPVASLDLAAREQTIRLLGDFAKSKDAPAIAMVTHHLEEVPEGFTHAMLLSEGKIVAAGAIDKVITDAKVSEAFKFDLRIQRQAGRFLVSAG